MAKMKAPLPFFPNLCLTDKLFGKEAATCLFSTAEITITCPLAQRFFLKITERFLEKSDCALSVYERKD
jgi:hypothetical protein